MEQTVVTSAGTIKRIIAPNAADLGAAVTVARAEVVPKVLDINNKSHGNKRYQDLS